MVFIGAPLTRRVSQPSQIKWLVLWSKFLDLERFGFDCKGMMKSVPPVVAGGFDGADPPATAGGTDRLNRAGVPEPL